MNIYEKLNDAFLDEDKSKTSLSATLLILKKIHLNENYTPKHPTSPITVGLFNEIMETINPNLPKIEEVLLNE